MGKLRITVVGANNVKESDTNGSSDPYCTVTVGEKTFKTQVQKNILFPRWNETFNFEAVNVSDAMSFEVWDWDRIGGDDILGITTLAVSEVIPGSEEVKKLPLMRKGVKYGELLVSVLRED
eukprot:TRINITY_DN16182_c0_g1_i1.p1 TRINITY_DN16182_c0_g1~~TRINITY_DN16182_c0_g1_i1.p1  ORF type:complete len:121 (-),score=26.08 TRINITY_DN16182_c0_g1_i1:125-487(-)